MPEKGQIKRGSTHLSITFVQSLLLEPLWRKLKRHLHSTPAETALTMLTSSATVVNSKQFAAAFNQLGPRASLDWLQNSRDIPTLLYFSLLPKVGETRQLKGESTSGANTTLPLHRM